MRLPDTDAIGLDLDDTLFDHTGAATSGARAFFTGLGVEATPALVAAWFCAEDARHIEWIAGVMGLQEQRRARVRDMLSAIGCPDVDDTAADELYGTYFAAYRAAWRAYPDALITLARMRDEGHRIGILTNGFGPLQRTKVEETGIGAYIDVICASSELGVAKPHPEAFASLLQGLGSTPERTVFVGDSRTSDLEGARRAGIRAALVRVEGRTVAELGSAIRRAAVS